MNELTLLHIGWHGYEGIEIVVLRIDFGIKGRVDFKGDLFSITSRFDKWLEIGILFFRIEIKKPF